MAERTPLHYEPAQNTYFTATLEAGASFATLQSKIVSWKSENDVKLSLLGSIGSDALSNELVFELADVPSGSKEEATQRLQAFLANLDELDNLEVMQFKQRRKR